MPKIPCSVEILTRNSEQTLERCLESVKDFDDILILDGNSTDRTREIALRFGCRIIKQYETDKPNILISDYSEVRNRGLKLASHDWFMFIDSDEYLSPEAAEEIRTIITNPNPPAHAFWQPRKYTFDDKIIDCATTYPNQQVRFFNRNYVERFIKPVHEKIKIKPGITIGTLKNFEYVPIGNIKELKGRWGRYMKRELEMVKGAPFNKLLRLIFQHSGLFTLYAIRYFRGLLFCRGVRMPLRHECARHLYTLRMVMLLIGRLLRIIA